MDYLSSLENQSIYIIREAYAHFRNNMALLWSIGKDSTTLLWLARKAFFGNIPFPVIHIDTTFKFEEIYDFRDMYRKKWGLNLIISKNRSAINNGMCHEKGRLECCNALKTEALKDTVKEYGLKALLLAIRRDEHGIRAKERIFSPRDESFGWNYLDQPLEMWERYETKVEEGEHLRIHPLLGWREIDVWEYIKRERMPVASLYFSKKGMRYRSIGCRPCCRSIESDADTINKIIKELKITRISERSGRAQDKEDVYAMEKLRSLGYM